MRPQDKSLWRHGDFMKLWGGETVSKIGSQVSLLAIPLIAITVLKVSTFEVGLLSAVEFSPFILVALHAGVWVDRFPKKRILVLGDLGRGAMLVSIPVAFALGGLTIWQLYLVGFVNGVMTVFFDVADQSYLPTILEREDLVEGNAKLQISQSSAQILGQPVGGGVVALVGAPVAVLVDAVSYLGSALLILWIRVSGLATRSAGRGLASAAAAEAVEATASTSAGTTVAAEASAADRDEAQNAAGGAAGGMRSQIRDGLNYILRHEYLGNIAATTATSNLFGNIGFAIFPVFAYRELQMSPAGVGTVGGLGGAGVLLGALVASRVSARLGIGRTIIVAIGVFAPFNLLIPLATPELALLFLSIAFFVTGVSNVVYNVAQVSLRQAITPEHFLGRMNATMRFLVWGTIPVGSLIGAGLSEVIGVRPTIWISAILGLFAFLPVFFSKVRSIQTIPTEDPNESAAAGA